MYVRLYHVRGTELIQQYVKLRAGAAMTAAAAAGTATTAAAATTEW